MRNSTGYVRFLQVRNRNFPDPWADPKSRFTLGLCNRYPESIRIWGSIVRVLPQMCVRFWVDTFKLNERLGWLAYGFPRPIGDY